MRLIKSVTLKILLGTIFLVGTGIIFFLSVSSKIVTNNTIISKISSLEKELEITKLEKRLYEMQISYRDMDITNAEADEHKRLIAIAEKKNFEQKLKKTDCKIEKLTKKIEKAYKRLAKRNTDYSPEHHKP